MLYARLVAQTNKEPFIWQQAVVMTVRSIRTKCNDWARRLERAHTKRKHTSRPFQPPKSVGWFSPLTSFDVEADRYHTHEALDPLIASMTADYRMRLQHIYDKRRARARRTQRPPGT